MNRIVMGLAVAFAAASIANAQCDDWLDGFVGNGPPSVRASTTWTAGGVERLVLAFDSGAASSALAGDAIASGLVAWDGAQWDSLGGGVLGEGRALASFDDGGGPALFVGGVLTSSAASAVSLANIARWDGAAWSDVGGGVAGPDARINALAAFDDGSGAALYAAGSFSTAGGAPASNVARWDGAAWTPVGGGLTTEVLSLCVFDDGAGAKLYAGRVSKTFGGSNFDHLSVWDGANWSAVPLALDGGVHTLASLDLGAGPRLFAGGDFTFAGNVLALRVASWDGAAWTAYPGVSQRVRSLEVFDTSAGPRLFAGGAFSVAGGGSGVAQWDGAAWIGVAGGLPATAGLESGVYTLSSFERGVQRVLVAGGAFGLRYLFDDEWRSVNSTSGFVPAKLVTFDDGGGAAPYALGSGGDAGVWKYEQAQWTRVPGSPSGLLRAIEVFDTGAGQLLYVGGALQFDNGAPASDVQVFDGASWSSVGVVPDFTVSDFAILDAGVGPQLYAAGAPVFTGGVPSIPGLVIRWDGAVWSAFGGPSGGVVNALAVYDDGAGPALYAGGNFAGLANGVASRGLAKWNGSVWSGLGSGVAAGGGVVSQLVTWNDGGGERLYLAGSFLHADFVPGTSHIASWDGASFAPLGVGWSLGVSALVVDVGTSPSTLVAGGTYSAFGPFEPGGLMRWNGAVWSPVGGGLSEHGAVVSSVAVVDVGDGVDLAVQGDFLRLGGRVIPNLGVFNRCATPGEPYCVGSGADTLCPCLNSSPVLEQAGCVNSSGRAALLRADGSTSVVQDDLSLRVHGVPAARTCVLFVGTSATNGGSGALFDDGLRCAAGAIRRLGLRTSDALGFANWGVGLAAQGGWLAGETRYFQTWYRDPNGPCRRGSNLTNGYRVQFTP